MKFINRLFSPGLKFSPSSPEELKRVLPEGKQRAPHRAYFQQLFDRSPEAIVLKDNHNKILMVNRSFEEIFGYSEGEARGQDIDNLIVPDCHRQEAEEINNKVQEGEIVKRETVRKTKEGEEIDVALLSYSIRLDENRIGEYAIYRDIRERKRLERRLIENKNKIERLHETALKMDGCGSEEEIYRLTIEAGEQILDFDVCSLDIVEDDMLVVKATSSGVPEGGSVSAPVDKGISGKAYRTGRTILTRNIENDEEADPVKDIYKSAITVPIGEFGIFQVISTEVDGFDKEDVKMAELLISHTTTALKRLESEKEIKYLGFHDSLTSLYNRAYLEEELNRLDTTRLLPISIIMGDVNGLKLVNDAFGHKEGDKLLAEIGRVIRNSCRQEDILGRWGGDEFLIILSETDRKEAEQVIDRIKNNCKKAKYRLPLSIALGVATKVKASDNINEIIKEADGQMYDNKIPESKKMRHTVIKTLLERLGRKSYESRDHLRRVKRLARRMASELNLTESEKKQLVLTCSLHDIGFINIPEKILKKRGKLNEEEWEVMKTHPEIGYRIARSSDEFAHLAEGILSHHERWDGQGYPRGLKGEDIPITGRIVNILDAYDIMTHDQLYKKAISEEEAVEELYRCAQTQFDPRLVEIFVEKVVNINR